MSSGDRTGSAAPVLALLFGLLGLVGLLGLAGCASGQDDEMSPPPSTVTASPSPRVSASPRRLPVGHSSIETTQPVWAQGSTLHVGASQADVAPLSIDSFVVVPGGLFFLDSGELWFTDLTRVRGTGLTGVTRLSTTRNGSAVLVQTQPAGGTRSVHAYDSRTGVAIPAAQVVPATGEDRLGRPVSVVLAPATRPLPARLGTGGYGVLAAGTGPLTAFESATRRRVPLRGTVGNDFELVRWTTGEAFYGLARTNGNPAAVLTCRLPARTCSTAGRVDASHRLVFESGA